MFLWLTAILLLVLMGLVGHYVGVIRVAASLFGLLLGAIFAIPLSPLLKPIFSVAHIRHPLLISILGPVIIFLVFLFAAKIVGYKIQQRAEIPYKYEREGRNLLQFERMNRRLGACLGLLNGTIYFILLLVPIYVSGYLTVQLETGSDDPAALRYLNKARGQLRSTGLDRVVAGYDPSPEAYYDAADILGLIKHNPLLWNRLSRYPAFLSLSERPELIDVANDVEVNQMFQTQVNVATILRHPKVQAIVTNAEVTAEITRTLKSDLKDMRIYLETGRSEKYAAERILGRWEVNIDGVAAEERKKRPTITAVELVRLKRLLQGTIGGVTLAATTDNRVILRSSPDANGQTKVLSQGSWQKTGDQYRITFADGNQTAPVVFANDDKLLVPKDGSVLVFDRQQ